MRLRLLALLQLIHTLASNQPKCPATISVCLERNAIQDTNPLNQFLTDYFDLINKNHTASMEIYIFDTTDHIEILKATTNKKQITEHIENTERILNMSQINRSSTQEDLLKKCIRFASEKKMNFFLLVSLNIHLIQENRAMAKKLTQMQEDGTVIHILGLIFSHESFQGYMGKISHVEI